MAQKRYYPGFLAAFFLVLLRVAIGWHFLYEGLEKYESTQKGDRPWSAEAYLRASTGPFAAKFRALVPDVDSLDALDPDRLKARWKQDLNDQAGLFGFDDAQKEKAEESLKAAIDRADAWYNDRENAEKLAKYREDVQAVNAQDESLPPLSFERERLADRRKGLEGTRRELVANVDGWTKTLQADWKKLATADQARQGTIAKPPSDLDMVNRVTTNGLILCGAGLILGLFTRLSALGGAALLTLFYLSMPPWPGLPQAPNSEGHYLIVNKNLIEFLACIFLALTPTGQWIGLDALLFGWIGRRRAQAQAEADSEAGDDRHASHSRGR